MPVQPDIPPAFRGDINVQVLSPGPNPTTILRVNTPFTVRVSWYIEGYTVSGLGGDWLARAFLESIGPGFENQVAVSPPIPVTSVPLGPGDRRTYSLDLAVPANPAINAGPYKLVVTITHMNAATPTQYAAYVEGPILQFIP
jgi:hypothetical protein